MDIYKNPNYLKEKNKFIFLLKQQSVSISDGENYIIGPQIKEYPIWIWSKDEIQEEQKEEIKKIIDEKCLQKKETLFVCKKALYDELEKNFQTTDYFEMGYLECNKLKNYQEAAGVFAKANYGDKILLAKLWQSFCEEAKQEKVDLKECLEEVAEWLKEDCFYVWKNYQGKVLAMASYRVEQDVAIISHVYTRKDERNKGYCTSLIYHLTKKLLSENLHPMLYTDYHYKPSNTSYKKVGYEEKGVLIRFKICI